MSWMQSLFDNWGAWLAAIGGAFGLLGWAIGLPSILKILSAIIDVLSPLLKLVTEGVVGLLRWFWNTLIWPDNPKQVSIRRGVTDIADDWVTVVCVALLMWGAWGVSQWQVDRLTDNLSTCQNEMVKLKREQHKSPGKSGDFLWPLW